MGRVAAPRRSADVRTPNWPPPHSLVAIGTRRRLDGLTPLTPLASGLWRSARSRQRCLEGFAQVPVARLAPRASTTLESHFPPLDFKLCPAHSSRLRPRNRSGSPPTEAAWRGHVESGRAVLVTTWRDRFFQDSDELHSVHRRLARHTG